MIEITENISIHEDELVFTASRSSGPGGQHVNKVNTRVTVLFDVAKSGAFSPEQKQLILERLSTRASRNGVVRVASQRYRTQKANREAATDRLAALLKDALKKIPPRKKTKIPQHAIEHRLEDKRHRSILKQERKNIE